MDLFNGDKTVICFVSFLMLLRLCWVLQKWTLVILSVLGGRCNGERWHASHTVQTWMLCLLLCFMFMSMILYWYILCNKCLFIRSCIVYVPLMSPTSQLLLMLMIIVDMCQYFVPHTTQADGAVWTCALYVNICLFSCVCHVCPRCVRTVWIVG